MTNNLSASEKRGIIGRVFYKRGDHKEIDLLSKHGAERSELINLLNFFGDDYFLNGGGDFYERTEYVGEDDDRLMFTLILRDDKPNAHNFLENQSDEIIDSIFEELEFLKK